MRAAAECFKNVSHEHGCAQPIRRRDELTVVQPGDTLRLEVYVQDLRSDDGDGVPETTSLGVYGNYVDLLYDADAFTIPAGTADNISLPTNSDFPIAFRNPTYLGDLEPGVRDYKALRYPYGPGGDVQSPGLIDNAGSFLDSYSPIGGYEFFQFDVLFQVNSYFVRHDIARVTAGSSVSIDVLANDELIAGEKTFRVEHDSYAGESLRNSVPAFGMTGYGPLLPSGQPYVPADRIEYVDDTVTIVNETSLQVIAVTQGSRGTVAIMEDGRLWYTPAVDGPATDLFTYTVSFVIVPRLRTNLSLYPQRTLSWLLRDFGG